MPIKAIISDFGDVLMRNPDALMRRQWETKLGLGTGDLDRLVFESEIMARSMVGKADVDEVWQFVGSTFSLSDDELEALVTDFWSGGRLDTELIDFLKSLRPDYRTAILSDAWLGTRQLFTERLKLDEVFDTIVISAEEGIAKPDPRIFQIALQRLQVSPQEAIFVDDRPNNVAGACAMGIHGILFQNTEQVIADVRRLLSADE